MTTDLTICGFIQHDGSLCHATGRAPGLFCDEHDGKACGGCGEQASRECAAPSCATLLCPTCKHISARHHAPSKTAREATEEELVDALELILERLDAEEVLPSTKVQRAMAAPRILTTLSTHVVMKVLAGLAQPPN